MLPTFLRTEGDDVRNDHTPAEKAEIGLGAGISGAIAARVLLYFGQTDATDLMAVGVGLVGVVIFCYGVGQLAVSRGHSAGWGFAGFFGYLIVRFLLKPKRPASWHLTPEFPHPEQLVPARIPPPPPPPGYVPSQ